MKPIPPHIRVVFPGRASFHIAQMSPVNEFLSPPGPDGLRHCQTHYQEQQPPPRQQQLPPVFGGPHYRHAPEAFAMQESMLLVKQPAGVETLNLQDSSFSTRASVMAEDANGIYCRSCSTEQVDAAIFKCFLRVHGCCARDGQTQLTVRHQKDGIRNIVLNNPKKRNALSLSMLTSLRSDILADVDSDDLRVIIISAEGPVFSSGHDLKELTSAQGKEYHSRVFEVCSEVMSLIQDIPVPVIAKVNGVATAAGCQLVASCDIAVATEKSTFATPGVNVGLFCSTPAVAIGRAVPRKVAMEMLFTGAPISAHDALLHGLVSKVVPEERLEEETMAIARRVCESSRPVVALGKATFYRQMAQGRDAAYTTASRVMVDNLALRDGQEGIRAFLEKRKPVWTNSTEKEHE
ncbi:hypothetical protein SKAU_G00023300 [Synaphobranchus kaupii]|uniref:Enoyl-CoA hydratase domain-containing protein 3, mitochondrial n=1 Tax=Synaphobranchus kaupii TaxID=118154 RepID=A0A9Q1JEM7_SYNKA|nr:hypothetical protein SKAU_G00023300 [Synaphobranchus kaupii]